MTDGLVKQEVPGLAKGAMDYALTPVQAEVIASVQARHAIAKRFPRDWDEVRAAIIRECQRPGFAEGARYSLPVGREAIEGPTIRFAEAAQRCMGNGSAEHTVIDDTPAMRKCRVVVTDFESNTTYFKDFVVSKTVERKNDKGRTVISSRTNSYGEKVYIVEATDEEVANKEASLASKAIRTCILRLLPGDILDEAMERCQRTLTDKAAKDPDGERKRLVDAFANINVTVPMLKEYLGHELATSSPAELVRLMAMGKSIRDGESTWAELMERRTGKVVATAPTQVAPPAPSAPPAAPTGEAPLPPAAPSSTTPEREPGSDDGDAPKEPADLLSLRAAIKATKTRAELKLLLDRVKAIPDPWNIAARTEYTAHIRTLPEDKR